MLKCWSFVAALLIASVVHADTLEEAAGREREAKRALADAKAEQVVATVAFKSSEATAKWAEAEFKKADEECKLLIAGYSGMSKLAEAQAELKAAADAIMGPLDPTNPVDIGKTRRIKKAQSELDKVSKQAGEVRARIKQQYAGRFAEDVPPTIEEILRELLKAAQDLKKKTAADFAAKKTTKEKADAAVEAAEKALREVQRDVRDEMALEEAKTFRSTVDVRLGSIEKSVSNVGNAVTQVAGKVDEGNKILIDMNASFKELVRIGGKDAAEALVQISKIGTATTAEAASLSKLLDFYTASLASAKDNTVAMQTIASELHDIKQLLEEKKKIASTSSVLQYYDPCTHKWYAVTTTTTRS